jgi:hypothetical protein
MNRSQNRVWDNPWVYLVIIVVLFFLLFFVVEVLINKNTVGDFITEFLTAPFMFLLWWIMGVHWFVLSLVIQDRFLKRYPYDWEWKSKHFWNSAPWISAWYREQWKPMLSKHPDLKKFNNARWISCAISICSFIVGIVQLIHSVIRAS